MPDYLKHTRKSTVTVTPEFLRVVRRLPKEMQKKVYTKATRDGAMVMAKAIRANLGESRNSTKSILVRKAKARYRDKFGAHAVGISSDRWWLIFKELGTGPRKPKHGQKYLKFYIEGEGWKTKAEVAALPAKPFMRPAIDTDGPKAIETVRRQLSLQLDVQSKKLIGPLSKSGLVKRRR